jgi:predicted RNA-binding Zn-ribbon protein involved in translation (DUF1610 family)
MDHEPMFASMVCSSNRQPAVIRFRWTGEAYQALGASKQRPGSVIPSSGNGAARGAFNVSPEYAGCPHCGADNFVRCGRCRELSCYDTSWEIFHCPRCGNSGRITGTIDSVSGLGSS